MNAGIQQFLKSVLNIDPEQMQLAMTSFQNCMTEIQQHLLAIEQEQRRQAAVLDRIHQLSGGLAHVNEGIGRPGDGFGSARN